MSKYVVNTYPSNSTPWTIKAFDPIHKHLNNMPNALDVVNADVVADLADKIMKLPSRINTPKTFTTLSFPRYYLVDVDDDIDDDGRIVIKKINDIIGIRADLSPTKWSYRVGYWHPKINIIIADVLKNYLSNRKNN